MAQKPASTPTKAGGCSSMSSSLLKTEHDPLENNHKSSSSSSRTFPLGSEACDLRANSGRSPSKSERSRAVSEALSLASASARPSPQNAYLSAEQRRRNEIAVHRAAKISYDKSFDARGSFVHFAQHGLKNFGTAPGSVRSCMVQDTWYDDDRTIQVRKLLRSQAFVFVSIVSIFIALFLADLFVICQVPDNSALDVILTMVFFIFTVELTGLSASEASYPFSFFFWMDMLGTISIVLDISYLLGPDATRPENFSDSLDIFRSSRAGRFGARAGRLGRVLKVLRLLPAITFCSERRDQHDQVKMARVISNQLNIVLSTRVVFFAAFTAIALPLFGMFSYPEFDDSLRAWTRILASNVAANVQAAREHSKVSELAHAKSDLQTELLRFARFYSKLPYGPFRICYGKEVGGHFQCQHDDFRMSLESAFDAPRRRGSIWEFTTDNLQVAYNMAVPAQVEAVMNISFACFTMGVILFVVVVVSGSITDMALRPLERMLLLVRDRCAKIFKYTSELEDGDVDVDDDDDMELDFKDKDNPSEFVLLEKAVSKLAAIAHLTTTRNEPEVTEEMNENDIMVLNMMGTQVPMQTTSTIASRPTTSASPNRSSCSAESDGAGAFGSSAEHGIMLTSISNAIPSDVMESMDGVTFNSLDIQKDVKITASAYMLLAAEGSANWVRGNVQESQLYTFMSSVESKYMPNPFHNFAHALDVLNAVFRFLQAVMADRFLSEVSQFWLLIAAIGHDIGHLGVSNQYLSEVSHELALTYNDRSPLENMHCAKLYQVLSEREANVFAQVEKELYKEMRKGIIDAILHTDVTRHSEMIKELSLLYQMNSEAFDSPDGALDVLQSQANTQLVVNALLHFADINNPMKPWELCQRIAYLCLDEFFAQGDLEKAAGIPVQMLNDRDKVNRPNSQIGFIEFMIAPMVESMVRIFPQFEDLADQLGSNCQCWFDVWVAEVSPQEEAKEKVSSRVNKVVHRCQAVIRIEGTDAATFSMMPLRGSTWFSQGSQ